MPYRYIVAQLNEAAEALTRGEVPDPNVIVAAGNLLSRYADLTDRLVSEIARLSGETVAYARNRLLPPS